MKTGVFLAALGFFLALLIEILGFFPNNPIALILLSRLDIGALYVIIINALTGVFYLLLRSTQSNVRLKRAGLFGLVSVLCAMGGGVLLWLWAAQYAPKPLPSPMAEMYVVLDVADPAAWCVFFGLLLNRRDGSRVSAAMKTGVLAGGIGAGLLLVCNLPLMLALFGRNPEGWRKINLFLEMTLHLPLVSTVAALCFFALLWWHCPRVGNNLAETI